MNNNKTSFEIDYDLARGFYPNGRYNPFVQQNQPAHTSSLQDVHKLVSAIGNVSSDVMTANVVNGTSIRTAIGNVSSDVMTVALNNQKYRPAFISTNETLRKSIPAFGNCDGDILTVAASGDQPIYYAINGAKHIDTFDITFCAKAMSDLKTAMVCNTSHPDYCKLMDDMYGMKFNRATALISKLPADTSEFIKRMSGCNIFAFGSKCDPRYFTYSEWMRAKNIIDKPFNFIWSDIIDLHKHLTQQYDVINTSNIFEWIDGYSVAPTVCRLFDFLKPNGYILASCLYGGSGIKSKFDDAAAQLNNQVRIEAIHHLCNEGLVILRRVR